jgi:hypothetical protein
MVTHGKQRLEDRRPVSGERIGPSVALDELEIPEDLGLREVVRERFDEVEHSLSYFREIG